MVAKTFAVSINLLRNELQNAVIQNLATAPSNPVAGLFYFDTSLDALRFYDGSGWVDVLSSEGLITSVSADLPITSTGGSSPTIGINDATQSDRGAMTASDKTKLDGIDTGATQNETDAYLLDRGNHTGTQAISTVSGLQSALDDKQDTAERGEANGYAPLNSSAEVPLANLPDFDGGNAAQLEGENGAHYLARANHTGTQAISTVSGLQSALDGKLDESARGAANGVASLDSNTKIPAAQLPAIAISSTHVVADLTARNALTVEEGDVAIVSDASPDTDGEPASYIYDGTGWQKLLTPFTGVASVTGGTGITSTGGDNPEISITAGGVGTTEIADEAVVEGKLSQDVQTKLNAPQGALKHAVSIGDGSQTEFVVTHNMDTRDVQVQVFQASSPYQQIEAGVELTTVDTATVSFAQAPSTNEYRVVVVG